KPWVTFRPSAEERRAGDLCCDGSRTLLSLSNPNKRTHSTRRNRVALGLRSYSSLTLSYGQLVELSERKAHGSLIQCKGAKPNHCSGRSHELRSLYQKKKKRKTPGLRGTARVGMVG